MKTLLPLWVVVVASGISSAGDSEAYYIARGFEETGGVSGFLSGRSLANIASLRHHKDLKVAIPAAWCLCVKKSEAAGTQQQAALHKQEFLGFVSGRLNTPLPEWWKKRILRYHTPENMLLTAPPGIIQTDGVSHRRDVVIEWVTDKWIIGELDRRKFWIPSGRKSTSDLGVGFIDVVKAPGGRQIFAVSKIGPSDVPVYCVDQDGTELWRAKKIAFVQESVLGRFGFWQGIMQLVVSGDRVMLFGEDESAIYLDIFSLKTGEVLCRFTTLVFYEREDQGRGENRTSGRPQGESHTDADTERTTSESEERRPSTDKDASHQSDGPKDGKREGGLP